MGGDRGVIDGDHGQKGLGGGRVCLSLDELAVGHKLYQVSPLIKSLIAPSTENNLLCYGRDLSETHNTCSCFSAVN